MASVAYFDSFDVRGYCITNISITNNDYISNTQKQPSEVFCQKGVLKKFRKFTRKKPVPKASSFIKNETLAQVFSCHSFTKHLQATASEY